MISMNILNEYTVTATLKKLKDTFILFQTIIINN